MMDSEDPRKIELVKVLTEKTREGKASWVKERNAITATFSGLEVNFVTQPTIIRPEAWQLFTVRDKKGSELIRVTPPPLAFFTPPSTVKVPTETANLAQAVDELFATVNRSAGDDLDHAISTIRNL
jgi:hypothetical protein